MFLMPLFEQTITFVYCPFQSLIFNRKPSLTSVILSFIVIIIHTEKPKLCLFDRAEI